MKQYEKDWKTKMIYSIDLKTKLLGKETYHLLTVYKNNKVYQVHTSKNLNYLYKLIKTRYKK